MRAVFLDSGAFIAFLDSSDSQNARVAALFGSPPQRLITSVLVVSETYSWFLHRMGEAAARRFRLLLDDATSLEVLGADAAHLRTVGRKLDRLRGRKLTLVDASSLVLMEQHHVSTVWGTDLDLGIEGASVVPGPSPR